MKVVRGCLGMVLLLILIAVVIAVVIGNSIEKGASPTPSTPAAPTASTSRKPEPRTEMQPSDSQAWVASVSAMSDPATLPSLAAPGLDEQFVTARAKVTSAKTELDKTKAACLARLRETATYKAKLDQIALCEQRISTERQTGTDAALAEASYEKLNLRSEVRKMEDDAIARDTDVNNLKLQHSQAAVELDAVKTEIARRDAERAAQRQRSEQAAAAQRATEREGRIRKLFSAWDGSHAGVKDVIRKSMHNPDSFQHVETRCFDKGDYLLVYMSYRGTNAFGGVVSNSIVAKCDLDGNVLSVDTPDVPK